MHLVLGRRRLEIEQGLDIAAHDSVLYFALELRSMPLKLLADFLSNTKVIPVAPAALIIGA
jgi:hypothetical protein